MSKHTPAPWYWENGYRGLVGENGDCVLDYADCEGMWLPTYLDQAEANARLISAAPELLQELQSAVVQMEMAADCIEQRRYDEALLHVSSLMRAKKEAIAKATGQ